MFEERLPTHLWVSAQIHRMSADFIPVAVIHKGEKNSGLVLVKLNLLGAGFKLFIQARDLEGRMGWMAVLKGRTVDEEEADSYIGRSIQRDPDLWVLEIEDRSGVIPFDGPVF